MPRKNDPENVRLVSQVANALKVDLDMNNASIQVGSKPSVARSESCELEARVKGLGVDVCCGDGPGISIRRLDPVNYPSDALAPHGALYEVFAYDPTNSPHRVGLSNGDVYTVYIASDGIILSEVDKRGVVDNYQHMKKK